MGTLAYDPARLAALATALTTAADALDALPCPDDQARPALGHVRKVSESFRSWRTTVGALVNCQVLEEYHPVGPNTEDPTLATERVLYELYGWRLSTDPGTEPWAVPAATEAAALGYLLSAGKLQLETPEQVAAFSRRISAVLADPDGASAFQANVSEEGLQRLVATMSARRGRAIKGARGGDEGAEAEISAIDTVLRSVAHAVIDVSAPVSEAQSTLAGLTPYAAALLIAQLDGPDDVICALAEETFTRYQRFEDPLAPWEMPIDQYVGIGDLLFDRVAQTSPLAANQFVTKLLAQNPSLLLTTTSDGATVPDLLARALDPTGVNTAQAGTLMVPLLTYLQDPKVDQQPTPSTMTHDTYAAVRDALGRIAAPWALHFGTGGSSWSWPSEYAASDAFRFIVASEESFAAMRDASERWFDSLRLHDSGSAWALLNELQVLGNVTGQLGEIMSQRAGDQIVGDRALWDTLVQFLPQALNRGVGAAGVTGVPAKVAGKLIGLGVTQGAKWSEAHEVFGAPPPLEEALHDLELDEDQTRAVSAYLAMGAMLEVLIEEGRLPEHTPWPPSPLSEVDCPSGSYVEATDDWLDGTGINSEQYVDEYSSLLAARGAMLGTAEAAQRCEELRG